MYVSSSVIYTLAENVWVQAEMDTLAAFFQQEVCVCTDSNGVERRSRANVGERDRGL